MASWRLIAVAVAFVACAGAVAVASAQAPRPALKILGCPGAPWCIDWTNCSFAQAPGASCYDCNTRIMCTPVGGMLLPCRVPGLKHCVRGLCRRKPSADCASEAPNTGPDDIPPDASTDDPAEAPAEAEDPAVTSPEDLSVL